MSSRHESQPSPTRLGRATTITVAGPSRSGGRPDEHERACPVTEWPVAADNRVQSRSQAERSLREESNDTYTLDAGKGGRMVMVTRKLMVGGKRVDEGDFIDALRNNDETATRLLVRQ